MTYYVGEVKNVVSVGSDAKVGLDDGNENNDENKH
jgi:hypothetical protein